MMRNRVRLLLLASTLSAGCSCYTASVTGGWDFFTNSARNLSQEPVRYADAVCTTLHLKRLADRAWRDVCRASSGQKFSSDYEAGFKAGFADYIDAGGCGQPPPVPPFCRQLCCYRGQEGHEAILDWYAGFRHGATTARESGLREAILIPLSNLPLSNFRDVPAYQSTSHAATTDGPAATFPTLPTPQPQTQLPDPIEIRPSPLIRP